MEDGYIKFCESHNHDVVESLIDYPYVDRLNHDKKIILTNMIS